MIVLLHHTRTCTSDVLSKKVAGHLVRIWRRHFQITWWHGPVEDQSLPFGKRVSGHASASAAGGWFFFAQIPKKKKAVSDGPPGPQWQKKVNFQGFQGLKNCQLFYNCCKPMGAAPNTWMLCEDQLRNQNKTPAKLGLRPKWLSWSMSKKEP